MSGQSSFPILPPGTALIPGGLYDSYGAVIISIIVSSYLLGILTVQTYMYFNASFGDPLFIKGIVVVVWLLDVGQFASCVDFAWWYTISNWGNVGTLAIIRPSFGMEVILGSTIIAIAELMFLRRVWVLSKRSILIALPLLFLIIIQLVFGLIGGSTGVHARPFAEAIGGNFASAVVIIWLGSGVAVDCSLSGLLCYYLITSRSGLPTTDSVLKKLVHYTMNTCLLTSFVAIVNIICFFAMRQNYVHVAFNMLLCKLFSNSLLASLNARRMLRREMNNTSFSATNRSYELARNELGRKDIETPGFRQEGSELDDMTAVSSSPVPGDHKVSHVF